jgi:hypothetical protein
MLREITLKPPLWDVLNLSVATLGVGFFIVAGGLVCTHLEK